MSSRVPASSGKKKKKQMSITGFFKTSARSKAKPVPIARASASATDMDVDMADMNRPLSPAEKKRAAAKRAEAMKIRRKRLRAEMESPHLDESSDAKSEEASSKTVPKKRRIESMLSSTHSMRRSKKSSSKILDDNDSDDDASANESQENENPQLDRRSLSPGRCPQPNSLLSLSPLKTPSTKKAATSSGSTPMPEMLSSATSKWSSKLQRKARNSMTPARDSRRVHSGHGIGAAKNDVRHLDWYKNPRDHSGRLKGDAGYNPRQLRIPESAYARFTNAHKQFWRLRENANDGVFFFKVGKFYELFHGDAELGHELCSLNWMGNPKDLAHVGFPEVGFDKYAKAFSDAGYNVYRIEQTETNEQLAERRKTDKRIKCVRREICQVFANGALTEEACLGTSAEFMMAVLEETEIPVRDDFHVNAIAPVSDLASVCDSATVASATTAMSTLSTASASETRTVEMLERRIAVAFVDVSTHQLRVGSFTDDRTRTSLRTLLTGAKPSRLLLVRSELTPLTWKCVRNEVKLKSVVWMKDDNVYDANRCRIALEHYFGERSSDDMKSEELSSAAPKSDERSGDKKKKWPALLSTDAELSAVSIWFDDLMMHCLGNLVSELKWAKLDNEVLPNSEWLRFLPVDTSTGGGEVRVGGSKMSGRLMLDGQTLSNLHIFENDNGTSTNTLFEFVDNCHTAFGKRQLREWLKAPLQNVAEMNARLDAVEFFVDDAQSEAVAALSQVLNSLPDLQRLFSRISALGTRGRPMDKAIMFDGSWKKQKVECFCKVLEALRCVQEIDATMNTVETEIPSLVAKCTMVAHGFPDFSAIWNKFNSAFDRKKAEVTGVIVPKPGMNLQFDAKKQEIDGIKFELNEELSKARRHCRKVKFVDQKGKDNRYLLEVSKDLEVPDSWKVAGRGTKKVNRYRTTAITALVTQLYIFEFERDEMLKDSARALLAEFSTNSEVWQQVYQCLADLDCLLSLAQVSGTYEPMCRPLFVDCDDDADDVLEQCVADSAQHGDDCFMEARRSGLPFLELEGSVHPLCECESFIANDIRVGGGLLIVTGPNMGGKSTVLRQTCVATILAHLGCFVPADACRLTVCDRIFTRVGANDRILAGQSTFMVELEETATILRHATRKSVVILDELGRGTATFDGTGIAFAVARHLLDEVECRCLFATHYHGITEAFSDEPKVAMYYMDFTKFDFCDTVTFLYKFKRGICSESHGVSCARLAGLPPTVCDTAQLQSKELHTTMHAKEDEVKRSEDFDIGDKELLAELLKGFDVSLLKQ